MAEVNSTILRSRTKDLTGIKFGRLLVVSFSGYLPDGGTSTKKHAEWQCNCDCGNTKRISAASLKKSHTQSCGCYQKDTTSLATITHNKSKTKIYHVWQGIKERCYNQKNSQFTNYGGRGITVCQRWLDSFENFLADMGQPPSIKHSIDRINNDGDYEPSNCRWATNTEQCRNMRKTVFVEYNGKVLSRIEWSSILGISDAALRHRLKKWKTVKRCFETPIDKKKQRFLPSRL